MAFMIPYKSDIKEEELLSNINKHITKQIGAIAKLDKAVVVPGLPKTRSGKLMRRVLRKVAANELESLGDTSTLLNPEIVDDIIKALKS